MILSQIQKLCVYWSIGVPEQDKPVIRKALVEMTGDLSGSESFLDLMLEGSSHVTMSGPSHFSSTKRSGTICEFWTCDPGLPNALWVVLNSTDEKREKLL